MMQESVRTQSTFQIGVLVTMRILIGWHFFYEGLSKVVNPYWSSAGYLNEAQWWFKGIFTSLVASPTALTAVDFLNAWGLTLVGLGLIVGALTRTATIAGIVILALYYIAAPPFVGLQYSMPAEGSYLVVNKVLIELSALLVLLAFPTGKLFGLDRLVSWRRSPERKALTEAQA